MDILMNFIDTGALGGMLTYKHVIMLIVGGIFLYLAIAKQYEPLLLVPIGFGYYCWQYSSRPCAGNGFV